MNDDLKPQSFDLEAWRQRMTQPTESPDDRAARKAVEKRARELSMSVEALAWFMALENKIAGLSEHIVKHQGTILDLNSRLEALENPHVTHDSKPKIWRLGQ